MCRNAKNFNILVTKKGSKSTRLSALLEAATLEWNPWGGGAVSGPQGPDGTLTQGGTLPQTLWSLLVSALSVMNLLPRPLSGLGWFKARSQAPSDRGEPTEEEEGGDGSDAAGEAGAGHGGVGAHQDGDWSPPTHQRRRFHLETEAQISGEPHRNDLKFSLNKFSSLVYAIRDGLSC